MSQAPLYMIDQHGRTMLYTMCMALVVLMALGCGAAQVEPKVVETPRPRLDAPRPEPRNEPVEPLPMDDVAAPAMTDQAAGKATAGKAKKAPRRAARKESVDVVSVDRTSSPEPVSPTPTPAEDVVASLGNILDHIYFKQNETGIDGYEDVLDAFAELATDDGVRLILIAHADVGESDPQDISHRRATVVKRYLVARGVPEHRLHVRAVGARAPLNRQHESSGTGAGNRCVQLAVDRRAHP